MLLFSSEEAYNKWRGAGENLYDETGGDINIAHITDYICQKIDSGFPGYYILRPNFDHDTAELRAEVFGELYEDAKKRRSLDEVMPLFTRIKKSKQESFDAKNEYQKQHHLLEAVCGYIDCVEKLRDIIKDFDSRFFVRLSERLEQITFSGQYEQMKGAAFALVRKSGELLDISLSFDCQNQIVRLDPSTESDEGCIYKKIASICASQLDLEIKTEFSIVNPNPISFFEEDIIKVLSARAPEFFSELADFYEKYISVGFYEIIEIKHQFLFYLGYIAFVKDMENRGYAFCLPVLNGSGICFKNAYDLSLALKRDNFCEVVANDISMPRGTMFILSGPNQGGKTTFIRSIAINIILASSGCFAAAGYCEIFDIDNLLTHFNRTETIGKGGRLEEELGRISVLLPKLTKNSFILFNECFASTRRVDGVRLALKLLGKLDEIGCTGGFVTHYYEIPEQNEKVVSLVAGVTSSGDKNDIRTYKITKRPPGQTAYARSIAEKCRVTFEGLSEVIEKHEKA